MEEGQIVHVQRKQTFDKALLTDRGIIRLNKAKVVNCGLTVGFCCSVGSLDFQFLAYFL